MAVPKKRTSQMKKKMRRAHHALKQVNVLSCSQCGEPSLPHRACPSCGYYKGKQVVKEAL